MANKNNCGSAVDARIMPTPFSATLYMYVCARLSHFIAIELSVPQALPVVKANMSSQYKLPKWGRLIVSCSTVHSNLYWYEDYQWKKYDPLNTTFVKTGLFLSLHSHYTPQVTFNLLLVSNYQYWQKRLTRRWSRDFPRTRDEAHRVNCSGCNSCQDDTNS